MSPDELLRELGELATSLGPAVRPAGTDELLRSLTETARQLFGAAACSLALLSEDESELLYTVAAGEGADDVTGMRISSSQGIAGWVVQSGQPIAISDLASDPRFSRDTGRTDRVRPAGHPRGAGRDAAADARASSACSTATRGDPAPSRTWRCCRCSPIRPRWPWPASRRSACWGGCCWTRWPRRRPASDLVLALRRAADRLPAADADLAALAATFAALARRGAAERRLALAVLRDVGSTSKGGRHDLAKAGMERRLRPGDVAPGATDRSAHRQGLGLGRGLRRRGHRGRGRQRDRRRPPGGRPRRAGCRPAVGPGDRGGRQHRGPARRPVRSRHRVRRDHPARRPGRDAVVGARARQPADRQGRGLRGGPSLGDQRRARGWSTCR